MWTLWYLPGIHALESMFLVRFLPKLFGTSRWCCGEAPRSQQHSRWEKQVSASSLVPGCSLNMGKCWGWERAGERLSLFCFRAAFKLRPCPCCLPELCLSYACALLILMLVWLSGVSLVLPCQVGLAWWSPLFTDPGHCGWTCPAFFCLGTLKPRSSAREQWPEVVWKENFRRPLKESLLFAAWAALLQRTSKKVCSSKSRMSKGKMGNLKEISTIW